VDDFASHVLDVVDSIPPGRVMSYGDIAEHLAEGAGPRQVGRVMAVYGGAVAWWRVIHSDGTPAPGHDSRALQHYLAEGTPLRSARPQRVAVVAATEPAQQAVGVLQALGSLRHGRWWPPLDEVIETARTFYPDSLAEGQRVTHD